MAVTELAFNTLLHSTTLPPLPLSVALASMTLSALMVTRVAWRIVPLPCQSPPINTMPPPLAPRASMWVPLASVMSSPSSRTRPATPSGLLALSNDLAPKRTVSARKWISPPIVWMDLSAARLTCPAPNTEIPDPASVLARSALTETLPP